MGVKLFHNILSLWPWESPFLSERPILKICHRKQSLAYKIICCTPGFRTGQNLRTGGGESKTKKLFSSWSVHSRKKKTVKAANRKTILRQSSRWQTVRRDSSEWLNCMLFPPKSIPINSEVLCRNVTAALWQGLKKFKALLQVFHLCILRSHKTLIYILIAIVAHILYLIGRFKILSIDSNGEMEQTSFLKVELECLLRYRQVKTI